MFDECVNEAIKILESQLGMNRIDIDNSPFLIDAIKFFCYHGFSTADIAKYTLNAMLNDSPQRDTISPN